MSVLLVELVSIASVIMMMIFSIIMIMSRKNRQKILFYC